VLPVVWLIVAVVAAVLLSMWVTFTITRLDRLHARVDAAQAALDAQLVRRAAALLHVAQSADSGVDARLRAPCGAAAEAALALDRHDERQAEENAVGRMVADLAGSGQQLSVEAEAEIREAAARVQVARRFYNDAVRDTRALRGGRMPRLLRLAGHAQLPQFFDIDDTLPPTAMIAAPADPPSELPQHTEDGS
jgi:hypothetical protein